MRIADDKIAHEKRLRIAFRELEAKGLLGQIEEAFLSREVDDLKLLQSVCGDALEAAGIDRQTYIDLMCWTEGQPYYYPMCRLLLIKPIIARRRMCEIEEPRITDGRFNDGTFARKSRKHG